MALLKKILPLFILLWSCSFNHKEKTHYPNGHIKTYRVYSQQEEKNIIQVEEEYYENGRPKLKGSYDTKGRRAGIWKSWYESGTLWSKCEYFEGKKQGINQAYYPNGQLRYKGQYKNDAKKGLWTFYQQDGKLSKTLNLGLDSVKILGH